MTGIQRVSKFSYEKELQEDERISAQDPVAYVDIVAVKPQWVSDGYRINDTTGRIEIEREKRIDGRVTRERTITRTPTGSGSTDTVYGAWTYTYV